MDLPPFRTGRTRREQGTCAPVPCLDLPFTVLEGAAPGPVLLVTAGVHGAEFGSIEAALRLTRLDPASLSGTRVVLPILNPAAFRARAPFVMPQDGKTLNRMGRPSRRTHGPASFDSGPADPARDEEGWSVRPAKDLEAPVRAGEALGEILSRLTSLSVNQGEALLGVGSPLKEG